MCNDHSTPERFKFTTPYPFTFTVRKEGGSRRENLHSTNDEQLHTDNFEHLKQFRAHPIPARTFLLHDQFKNRSIKKTLSDHFKTSSSVCHSSSMPNLNLIGLQRQILMSNNSGNFSTAPSPKIKRVQPYAEFMIEQEIMREIRVKHRANQLMKASHLPFSGSHWKYPMNRLKASSDVNLSDKFQKGVQKNDILIGHQPVIRSPKCKFRDVPDDNENKSEVIVSSSQTSGSVADSKCVSKTVPCMVPDKKVKHKTNPQIRSDSDLNTFRLTPRMTHTAMLREYANRQRQMQKINFEQYMPKSRQNQEMKNAVMIHLACHPISSCSNAEKQRALRDADRMRAKEYQEELKEMMERVNSAPLLMERQSKMNAIQKMENKFKEILRNHGLDEDFVHANKSKDAHHSGTDSVTDNDSDKDRSVLEGTDSDLRSSSSEESDDNSNCASELPERDLS